MWICSQKKACIGSQECIGKVLYDIIYSVVMVCNISRFCIVL